ncbi:hypothetical protein ACFQJ7_08585 [Halovenus rubra]|uniref:Uncharacterized protein n=2 Tax=Halovenus rubra TaxID=869890 RepID=A0ABD5X4H9_9EURY|nr:hypothetical protein [Halovenus rubra]
MSPQSFSRRRVLKSGAGMASAIALAGCLESFSDEKSTTSFDAVPADATFITRVDINRALDDELFRDRIKTVTEAGGLVVPDSMSVQEMLNAVEANIGLDLRDAQEIVAFGNETGFAFIIVADWSEADITAAVEDARGELTSTTHASQSIYKSSRFAVGVVPDGRYVIGNLGLVRTSLDVAAGNDNALSGNLAEGMEATPDGYLQFAFELSPEMVPEQSGLDSFVLDDIMYGYGGLYRSGDSRGGELIFETTGTDSASTLVDDLTVGLQNARTAVADDQIDEIFDGDVTAVLEATTVTQDAATVTLKTDDGRGLLASVPPTVLLTYFLELGSSSGPVPPTANLQLTYDKSTESLTITHEAGDAIPASDIFVRGTGVPTGSWAALGGETDDRNSEALVVAGSQLQLTAESDFDVRVFWNAEASDPVLLGQRAGPDA